MLSEITKKQEITSRNTSINGSKLPRVFNLVNDKFGWEEGTTNLDIGGGRYDNATEFLDSLGVFNLIYDPFNRPEDYTGYVLRKLESMSVDTVTLSNVLCVIKEREIQNNLIEMAYASLKPGGTLYLTVYKGNGDNVGRQTGKDQWQEHRPSRDYLSQVESVFGSAELRWDMIRAIKE